MCSRALAAEAGDVISLGSTLPSWARRTSRANGTADSFTLDHDLTIGAGDVRDGYAWHESAIGYANALMRTEVNYIPTKTSWLASGLLKAGAVVRNANGVVRVQMDET